MERLDRRMVMTWMSKEYDMDVPGKALWSQWPVMKGFVGQGRFIGQDGWQASSQGNEMSTASRMALVVRGRDATIRSRI